jgi:Transglycosylase SLT domain
MVAPLATRRPDPRHIGTPLPAPLLCSAAPPGGSRAHRRAPDRRSFLSIPRTPSSRSTYRKPARRTLAAAGTTVAAAALAAVGLATVTPAGPGAASTPGPALTVHGGPGARPRAQMSLDGRGGSRAGGGSPASQLAAGVSPVTATGQAILASGLAAGATLDGTAKHLHRAAPAGQAQAGHRAHLASARHTGPCATSTLHRWICAAEHTLEQHGVARGRLSTNAAYIVVKHESGANPHAYNGWDSNAAAGHPSEGIAQVIGPTFRAYALGGHHNIWNPVDNMIAAFRYAISRYGSMNNIPGVVNVRQGGSYVGY